MIDATEPPWPPIVGAVYRIPDSLTGWSDNPAKQRWAMVVAVNPPVGVRVLPRSASSEDGVLVPAVALGCFTKNGSFFYDPKSVPFADLRTVPYGGMLEPPYRTDVLDFYYDELRRRKQRRRRPPRGPR